MLGKRLLAFFSLVSFSALIFGYLWWGRFQYDHGYFLVLAYFGAVFIVAANHIFYRDSFLRLGLRWDNFWKAARWYGGATLVCGAIIVVLGMLGGKVRLDRWSDVYGYFAWALVQQYALQNFLRLRSEVLFGAFPRDTGVSLKAVFLAASLFGVYHLPNYPLVGLAFLGALLWCALFARIPNFFWAWLSHSLLTTLLLLFFKYDFVSQFQIGPPGYRYEFYGSGVKVAAGYDGQGNPVIATVPGSDRGTQALVRIFTIDGRKLAEWEAFEKLDFSGEISLGDLGFGAGDELAVSPGPGSSNPPLVRTFDLQGDLLSEFQPYGQKWGYGAWISVSCGRLYVSPGPGPNNPQEVFELSPQGQLLSQWTFSDLGLVNGLRATALCTKDRRGAETSPAGRTQPVDRNRLLLWGSDISINPSTMFLYDADRGSSTSFETLGTHFGINAAVIGLGQGRFGVAVAPGPLQGYPPQIQVFDFEGKKVHDFFAFDDPNGYGSNIATVDIDADGKDEIVLGEGVGPERPSLVRVLRANGELVTAWEAYPE